MCRTRLSGIGVPSHDIGQYDLIDARVFVVCILQRPAFQQLLGKALPEKPCATCDKNFHRSAVFGQALHPAQSLFGASSRAVLAAHPSFVTRFIEQPHQVAAIDFAFVGLMPIRHARDLYVADVVEILFELHCEVAFDDLRMIKIHLHFQVGLADLCNDCVRVGLRIQEVPRYVARIDRLDQHRAAGFCQFTRRETKVLYIDSTMRGSIAAGRNDPAHRVQIRRLRCFGVFHRACKRCAKIAFTAGKRSQAALTGGEIAGPQIQSTVLQATVSKPLRNVVRRMVVRKQQLDRLETIARSGSEPLFEWQLSEKHSEIGCEFRHRLVA